MARYLPRRARGRPGGSPAEPSDDLSPIPGPIPAGVWHTLSSAVRRSVGCPHRLRRDQRRRGVASGPRLCRRRGGGEDRRDVDPDAGPHRRSDGETPEVLALRPGRLGSHDGIDEGGQVLDEGTILEVIQKGYRLGFQASSDHWSTHISYCIALAEKFDREGILDALRKRHCYGATDDIILDVRSGPYIMGDEFKTGDPPSLQINAVGTQAIARVDILKDSKVVHSFEPKQKEFKGAWTDPDPTPGTHYYYVRVTQVDDELAWGSPMWIEFAR